MPTRRSRQKTPRHGRRLLREQPISRLFPNMITLAGMCCGLSSIRFALAERWEMAVTFIIVAALIDGMDGRVARMLGATSTFGAQLDSLSDFLCFGVAPVLVLYLWQLHDVRAFGWAVVLFFAVCAALRLARFNTGLFEQEQQPWEKQFFVGVPSPAGGILCLLPLILGLKAGMEYTSLCMVEFASARPHLAGYLFVLLFCAILHHSRHTQRYGTLLALPLLMLVWVNSHGSFLAGLTLPAAYALEALYTRQRAWLKRLLLIFACCLLATLVNPYGTGIYTGAMQSLDSDVRSLLIEWQPFSPGASVGLSVWFLMFLLAISQRNPQLPLADKIIGLAWAAAALLVARNGAIFVLVSAPLLASGLDLRTRSRRKPSLPPSVRRSSASLWSAAVLLCAMFSAAAAILPHEGRLQSPSHSIDDAIAYIKRHEPARRYLSDFDFGGQIIYRTEGRLAFFMDSRSNTAYAPREMKNYLAYVLQTPGWEEAIRAYGITGIIAHNASAFAKNAADGQYQGRWHLVCAGKVASVYIAAP